MKSSKTSELDQYFRCSNVFTTCEHAPEMWVFQVAVVTWDQPYNPHLEWRSLREWKTEPDDARITRAKEAALQDPRFFRMCSMCKELNNIGHMDDDNICQGCASEHLGVKY